MRDSSGGIAGNLRFFGRVFLVLVLLLVFLEIVGFINSHIPGGLGLGIAIIGTGALAFGLLLAYHIGVDWLNLRLLRRTINSERPPLDGKPHAIVGTVRTEGAPLTAPFTDQSCAAYRYRISRNTHDRHRHRRFILAEGLHMLPTHIETTSGVVALRSFPGVESELWDNHAGRDWSPKARSLMKTFDLTAGNEGERAREAMILRALHEDLTDVHADFMLAGVVDDDDVLSIQQESLPADEPVCVIGTWDESRQALNGIGARFGPNLMAYRGTATGVLQRVGQETAGFAKIAAVLIGIGLLALTLALLPVSISSKIPLIGWGDDTASVNSSGEPLYLSANDLAAIQREVAEHHVAGDTAKAMAIAVRANSFVSVRQLLDDGVSANAPMRQDDGSYRLPLLEAARLGYLETTGALLEAGADPNQSMLHAPSHLEGKSALDLALEFGRCEVAGLLLRYKAVYRHGMENYRCP